LGVALTILYSCILLTTVTNIVYLRRRRRRRFVPDRFPSVSVLIPARNEEQNLQRLLPSLLEQHYEALEIIVYDDASEDATADVVRRYRDARLHLLEGTGPPAGWVGKVHALYQATRNAQGGLFLFLDADARLKDPHALRRLVEQYMALPRPGVLSGLMELTGRGELVVSLIPFTLMTLFSIPLAARIRKGFTGVLGGACWMIAREDYFAHEPHQKHPGEVLEDLVIARYLKGRGVVPFIHDLQPDVEVRMYGSLREAWAGFRKNSSLMGGGPVGFTLLVTVFASVFLLLPAIWWPGIVAVYAAKLSSDQFAGFSLTTTLLAPVSFVFAILITLDSAWGHFRGDVTWKGRDVSGLS
jgi:glycosyltransferase involved in cell wall biosynthesis